MEGILISFLILLLICCVIFIGFKVLDKAGLPSDGDWSIAMIARIVWGIVGLILLVGFIGGGYAVGGHTFTLHG